LCTKKSEKIFFSCLLKPGTTLFCDVSSNNQSTHDFFSRSCKCKTGIS
jgi:hypothetical protein